MTSSRADWRRFLDFSAIQTADASMASAILGRLGRLRQPQTLRELSRWFHGTPAQFVSATVGDMVQAGQLRAARTSLNRRCVLEYFLPEAE